MSHTTRNDTAQRATGNRFESLARQHLESRGLRLLGQNFLCRQGEIDLVMRDGATIVFVEVRYRSSAGYGGALASITWGKRRRIAAAAQVWLLAHRQYAQRACRFDVVAFEGEHLRWLRAAFDHPLR
jgi:putative endonuclease